MSEARAKVSHRVNAGAFWTIGHLTSPLFLLEVATVLLCVFGLTMVFSASSIELVMKLLCAWLVVPVWGYRGASWGEPSTWAVCAVFITAVYFISRKKMYPDIG